MSKAAIKLDQKDVYCFHNHRFLNYRNYSFVFVYIKDNNSIQNEGIFYLSKALLPSLKSIGLCFYYCKLGWAKISYEGIRSLCKAKWLQL